MKDHIRQAEGLTVRVKRSKACGRYDLTADGTGMTGRSGTALLAETADRIGLTAALSAEVGGCRSWTEHDPGKVIRDLVVMLADGGDALRHMAVLKGQPVLFGTVASAATVNRTIVALGADDTVINRLSMARAAARARVWANGGAPPTVAAARRARKHRQTPKNPASRTLPGWRPQEKHYHSGIAYLHPADVHAGRAPAIVAGRQTVLDDAYTAHPKPVSQRPAHRCRPTNQSVDQQPVDPYRYSSEKMKKIGNKGLTVTDSEMIAIDCLECRHPGYVMR